MRISYCPPKAQGWGHSAGRISPVRLLDLAETFLRDQAVVVDMPRWDIEFAMVWQPTDSDPISAAVRESPLLAGDISEDYAGIGPDGKLIRRVERKIRASSLRAAVELLERLEIEGADNLGIGVLALHWFVLFRWQKATYADVPASTLSVSFGRPRSVGTRFEFKSVQHYREVQEYLQALGLAKLSDKHIRPKAALIGVTDA